MYATQMYAYSIGEVKDCKDCMQIVQEQLDFTDKIC